MHVGLRETTATSCLLLLAPGVTARGPSDWRTRTTELNIEWRLARNPCDATKPVRDADMAARVERLQERLASMYELAGLGRPAKLGKGSVVVGPMRLPGWMTGGSAQEPDLELFIRLSDRMSAYARSIIVIGNAFGYSTLALGLLFPAARVAAIDAEVDCSATRHHLSGPCSCAARRQPHSRSTACCCARAVLQVEGGQNARGSNITNAIAAAHGLNVTVRTGFSPWDVPELLRADAAPGPIDLAFIDGLHTTAQQFMDFAVLHPHLNAARHALVLHDVYLGRMQHGLRLVETMHGGYLRRYAPLNGCNAFGTHLATLRGGGSSAKAGGGGGGDRPRYDPLAEL